MIVDTSALLAVILGEDDAETIAEKMASAPRLAVSAATLSEARIVAAVKDAARGGTSECGADLEAFLAEMNVDVVPYTEATASVAERAWARFGKGNHPAKLNYGDCMSYATAKLAGEPLLFKGGDFLQTDIASA